MATPHFSDYTRGESVDFLNRFLDRVQEEASKEEYGTKKGFDMVAINISRVLQSYYPSNEVIESAQAAEKDFNRDGRVVSFRMIVNAFRSFYLPEQRQAAERIYNCMVKYGERIDKLSYVSETAAVVSFCKELTTEPQLILDVELLHLTQVVLDMQSANQAFDDLYNERLDKREKYNEDTFVKDLGQAVASCRSFYQMVNSNADLIHDVDYTPLLNKMNLLAEDYNQIAEKRIAIAKANKERGKEDTTDPSPQSEG